MCGCCCCCRWVVAHFQRIVLVDYLTGLGIPLPPYPGYNASLNPTTDTFFSTVAYRYGASAALTSRCMFFEFACMLLNLCQSIGLLTICVSRRRLI
jgi:hypothetical protein